MKKIGILGSGEVAKALGEGFLKHGYEVMLGTSNPGKLDEWKKKVSGSVAVGSFEQVAKFGGYSVGRKRRSCDEYIAIGQTPHG